MAHGNDVRKQDNDFKIALKEGSGGRFVIQDQPDYSTFAKAREAGKEKIGGETRFTAFKIFQDVGTFEIKPTVVQTSGKDLGKGELDPSATL